MNKEDILNMEAGEELDELIAEKVMGFIKLPFPGLPKFQKPTDDGVIPLYYTPKYSTDISAAWEVVEKILKMPSSVNIQCDFHSDGNYFACYIHPYPRDETKLIMEHAPTAPLAICRAALLAVMEL